MIERKRGAFLVVLSILVLGSLVIFGFITLAESEVPVYGGTLRIAVGAGVIHLDTQAATWRSVNEVTQYVYEGLTRKTAEGLTPWLAKNWEVSSGGLTVTILLEENVFFHDGTPFGAEAVKANFERKLNEKLVLCEQLADIEEIEILNEVSLRLHLSAPAPVLFTVLSAQEFAMYSPRAIEEGAVWLQSHMVGTGPFVQEEYVPEDRLVLTKNENYWQEGRPYLDRIELLIVPEAATRAAMLEAGDVDVAIRLDSSDYRRYLDSPQLGIRVDIASSGNQQIPILNNYKGTFADERLRLASNYAVDKEAIVETVYYGMAEIAKAPLVTPALVGYHETGYYPYNPDEANRILENAGWIDVDGDGIREKDGRELTAEYWVSQGLYEGSYDMALMVQDYLRAVGFMIKLVTFEPSTFRAKTKVPPEESGYEILNMSFTTATGDVWFTLNTGWHTSAWAPRYYNRMYYSNTEVDALIEQGNEAPTLEERNEAYAQALDEIYKHPGYIQLVVTTAKVAYRESVHGIEINPVQMIFPAAFAWKE